MKEKSAILTREELDVLILTATHPGDHHLNNAEIGKRLGIPVGRVKLLLYQACIKLGAKNRNEAILFAIRRGEIKLNELYTFDELVEFYSSLCPDMFRMISRIMRAERNHWHLLEKDEIIIRVDRGENSVLTKSEKDVLILIGRGLTNREIADKLFVSYGTVCTYLHRAYTKLGVHKKADAVMSAIKRGEISVGEMYSLDELLEFLTPLGADSIDKIAQLLSQKLEYEPMSTVC